MARLIALILIGVLMAAYSPEDLARALAGGAGASEPVLKDPSARTVTQSAPVVGDDRTREQIAEQLAKMRDGRMTYEELREWALRGRTPPRQPGR